MASEYSSDNVKQNNLKSHYSEGQRCVAYEAICELRHTAEAQNLPF